MLSQQGEAYQVEMPSGKRTKVKAQRCAAAVRAAGAGRVAGRTRKAIADEVDLDFLWEVAGQEEFGFAELGAEYFGHAPAAA